MPLFLCIHWADEYGKETSACHGSKLTFIQPSSTTLDGIVQNACPMICLLTVTWAHCDPRIPSVIPLLLSEPAQHKVEREDNRGATQWVSTCGRGLFSRTHQRSWHNKKTPLLAGKFKFYNHLWKFQVSSNSHAAYVNKNNAWIPYTCTWSIHVQILINFVKLCFIMLTDLQSTGSGRGFA